MSSTTIRTYGDPVLKVSAQEVTDIDGRIAQLAETMIEVMYAAPGSGLAANQIGVQRRVFVYDIGDGPMTIINPSIVESDGEWTFEEGILLIERLDEEQRAAAKRLLRERAIDLSARPDPDGLGLLTRD